MKYTKVVFVRYLPLTEAIYRDLYFNELLNSSIEIDYLDLSKLFFKTKQFNTDFKFRNTIVCKNYKEVIDYIKSQDNITTLYISIMTFEWKLFWLYRIFKKYNIILGVFARGVFPEPPLQIKNKLKSLKFKNIVLFLANKVTYFAKSNNYIKSYDYIFKAGKFGHLGLGLGSNIDLLHGKCIEVNTVDYDKYINQSNSELILKDENYIVFLDQYLPYHPDVELLNIQTVEPNQYFQELNIFFNNIESKTGKKVIIACHPMADFYKVKNPFNNRKLYFNKSNELVKNADLVITHLSTSLCFSICFNKPILLAMSQHIKYCLPHFVRYAEMYQEIVGANIVYMENEFETTQIKKINSDKYEDFKFNYLTSFESEKSMSSQIFINFLKNGD